MEKMTFEQVKEKFRMLAKQGEEDSRKHMRLMFPIAEMQRKCSQRKPSDDEEKDFKTADKLIQMDDEDFDDFDEEDEE
jgi:hypothetical protein